jgi:hypothetical protein
MLPVINDAIDARKVSIYNASVLPKNPLNGLCRRSNCRC